MATAADIILDMLESLGVYASGETLRDDDAQRCLIRLNDMVDSWSNESLTTFAILEQSFQLVVGVYQYTIGLGPPAGVIAQVRPIRINSAPGTAYLLDTNNNRYPVEVVPKDKWNLIGNVSTVTSNIPTTLYYDNQFPLGVINVFPVPNITYTLFWDSFAQLTEFPDLTTDITFPPGYMLALKTNLAVYCKPYFATAQLDPDIRQQARESKGAIKRANVRDNVAYYDQEIVSRSRGTYNIYRDTNF